MTGPGVEFEEALKAAIDGKTKPPGSLGRIEDLAAQIARVQGSLMPRMETCHHVIFAADHGIAAEGVSAFPQAVTREMVKNFLVGGAASTVFARTFGVSVEVVDAGVAGGPFDGADGLREARIDDGTASSLTGPAMTEAQVEQALATGREIGAGAGTDALTLGEMGIGNTSASALLAAKLTGEPVEAYVGRGTGLDDPGLARKTEILSRAATRTLARLPGRQALAEYGGFEIAMLAGAMIGAAEESRVVIIDGFIATSAAAVALDIAPEIRPTLVFSHRSAEAGHRKLCVALEADPLIDLGLRLGEGTGALLAWPLLKAAAAMLTDMASFESAGVSRA